MIGIGDVGGVKSFENSCSYLRLAFLEILQLSSLGGGRRLGELRLGLGPIEDVHSDVFQGAELDVFLPVAEVGRREVDKASVGK